MKRTEPLTTALENKITIFAKDAEERRRYIKSALASALRWYALSPDKRHGDEQHAVILIDLLSDL